MSPPVPQHTCASCGEYLPHACAPEIIVRRMQFGRKLVLITDREPEREPESDLEAG
jgi:hypothetical protein